MRDRFTVDNRDEIPEGMTRVDLVLSRLEPEEIRHEMGDFLQPIFQADDVSLIGFVDYTEDRLELYFADPDTAFEFKLRYV